MKEKNVIQKLQAYFNSYCHFRESNITLVLAFWVCATYIFEAFDAFPYLTITARMKRAGKTRLSEILGFVCRMPFPVAAATAPALFRAIQDDKPTLIWDEAESLSSESASVVRALLNVGYRKGQTIPRADGKRGIIQWPTFCPKVFVLIGDVYDTLRDRSIIVEMERANPEVMQTKTRFSYESTKAEGSEIADEIQTTIADNLEKITSSYLETNLSFLTDRDEEIWRPLFAICSVLCPELFTKLQMVCADLSADKTNPHRFTEDTDTEKAKTEDEFSHILLRDVNETAKYFAEGFKSIVKRNGEIAIPSSNLLELLKKIPTAPWRRFHSPSEAGHNGGVKAEGSGLTVVQMCYMLERFGVRPRLHRNKGTQPFRGYAISEIQSAYKKFHA